MIAIRRSNYVFESKLYVDQRIMPDRVEFFFYLKK